MTFDRKTRSLWHAIGRRSAFPGLCSLSMCPHKDLFGEKIEQFKGTCNTLKMLFYYSEFVLTIDRLEYTYIYMS